MNIIFALAFIFIFAVLNRARGSGFDNFFTSTTITRLLSMGLMSGLSTLRFLPLDLKDAAILFSAQLALLMLWAVPAWDSLWGAAIGSGSTHSKLWGTAMMTLRQALILPYYAFLIGWTHMPLWHAAYSATFLLMGVTYYLSGRFTPGTNVIRNPELANGAIIGVTTWLIGT